MKGTNAIRKKEPLGDPLQVAELFFSVQGEGPFQGRPATFVRLTGCPFRCSFCDTKWNDEADPLMPVAEIAAKAKRYNARLVIITGGEPVRWPLGPLFAALQEEHHEIQVETSGLYWQPALYHAKVVVAPKSGKVHPLIAENAVAWKYPVAKDETDIDGLPLRTPQGPDWTGDERPARPPWDVPRERIYVLPRDDFDAVRNEANLQHAANMALRHNYTFQKQVHKDLRWP